MLVETRCYGGGAGAGVGRPRPYGWGDGVGPRCRWDSEDQCRGAGRAWASHAPTGELERGGRRLRVAFGERRELPAIGARGVPRWSTMAQIGQRDVLIIKYENQSGFYLDGGDLGEILLPGRYRTPGMLPGTTVDVFVYRDSRDRLIATTEVPHAMVNEFAYLRVVSVERGLGAFLDWGLDKDLLLPIREFPSLVTPGDWIVVWIHLDRRSDRIVASGRTNRHVDLTEADYKRGDAVKLLISRITPLGYDAIINHKHSGLIYTDDSAEPLGVGQSLDGFVLRMRPDGKVDLTLHQAGRERIAPLTEKILKALGEAEGKLPLHDRSDPAEIQREFGVSKKAFKQAIGQLFRERRIMIESTGIRLVSVE